MSLFPEQIVQVAHPVLLLLLSENRSLIGGNLILNEGFQVFGFCLLEFREVHRSHVEGRVLKVATVTTILGRAIPAMLILQI